MKLIAERVGVSVPTVSRVLTGKAKQFRISKETAEAINKIAAELNYTPNKLASGLRLKRTQTLGLLIPDISNPFFASIARSIESSARRLGYSIILCDSEESTKLEAESLLLLQSRKVDGLLICPVGQESAHLISLLEKNVPVVFVDRYFPELKCPYVVSDNAKGAFEATSYLIENGHNAIACIQGLLNT
ncbi:MAG: LacI family DNA-binding transcriptional regulator, partial [Nitrososphaera sp.]